MEFNIINIITIAIGMIILILLSKLILDNKSRKGVDEADISLNITRHINSSIDTMSKLLLDSQVKSNQIQEIRLNDMSKRLDKSIDDNDKKLREIQVLVDAKLQRTLDNIGEKMDKLTSENNKNLEKIQETVDAKLQKTLENRITQSFQLVSERLEQVHKGLGEMQNLATGVGDLKRVLSNVKTRGILGEVQLGSILKEILAPSQYDENVPTKPRASERVEFAVKMPGEKNEFIYLPIDAKFPADAYSHLLDAYDIGDKELVLQRQKDLINAIKKAASDISKKYINPPYTTDFAVMFLPFEGLYAEVIRMNLVEELQSSYKINIAGPSTMAAMLNSLRMGFKTLAIQERSSKVWEVLADAKAEFEKFEEIIVKTQEKINQANLELDKLVGVRTRKINRVLRDISEPTSFDAEILPNIDKEII